jgi:hypothetical protein
MRHVYDRTLIRHVEGICEFPCLARTLAPSAGPDALALVVANVRLATGVAAAQWVVFH